ncbi:MAG: hypothetical protein DWQ10_07280 [Calditrichaeota bacterium]|nr:MAG: hypothetical protein DWQ10_07280 [Calditrichota bacterium]
MNEAKIRTLLGLARRARKLAVGASAVEAHLRKQAIYLILLAEDAGANKERKLQNQLTSLQLKCPVIRYANKHDLGEILNHPDVAIIGVLDRHFADGIIMHAHFDGK